MPLIRPQFSQGKKTRDIEGIFMFHLIGILRNSYSLRQRTRKNMQIKHKHKYEKTNQYHADLDL